MNFIGCSNVKLLALHSIESSYYFICTTNACISNSKQLQSRT